MRVKEKTMTALMCAKPGKNLRLVPLDPFEQAMIETPILPAATNRLSWKDLLIGVVISLPVWLGLAWWLW